MTFFASDEDIEWHLTAALLTQRARYVEQHIDFAILKVSETRRVRLSRELREAAKRRR